MKVPSQNNAQHSVHQTGGSLRVFRQFVGLEIGSVKDAFSRPAHQRVTPTVRALQFKRCLRTPVGSKMFDLRYTIDRMSYSLRIRSRLGACTMDGKVIAVSCSAVHNFSKQNQERIRLIAGLGVED